MDQPKTTWEELNDVKADGTTVAKSALVPYQTNGLSPASMGASFPPEH